MLHGEEADSRDRTGNVQDELRSSCTRNKEVLKEWKGYVKWQGTVARFMGFLLAKLSMIFIIINIVTDYNQLSETGNNDSIQKKTRMNKWKVWWRMGYSHSFLYLPHKILINYKGGKITFTTEKSDRHHLH